MAFLSLFFCWEMLTILIQKYVMYPGWKGENGINTGHLSAQEGPFISQEG